MDENLIETADLGIRKITQNYDPQPACLSFPYPWQAKWFSMVLNTNTDIAVKKYYRVPKFQNN